MFDEELASGARLHGDLTETDLLARRGRRLACRVVCECERRRQRRGCTGCSSSGSSSGGGSGGHIG